MPDRPNLNPPAENASDKLMALVRVAASVNPYASAALETLLTFTGTGIENRWHRWADRMADELRNQPAKIAEELPNNERFITALLHATQIATRNHSSEKLDALRNGVFSSIPLPSYDESLQVHFLQLIDRFTRWHFELLRVINEPNFMKNHGVGRENALRYFQKRFPTEFEKDRTLLELILSELSASGLIEQWTPRTYSDFGGSPMNPCLTVIGKHFLDFISAEPK
jgi:hypothetical protein